MSAPIPFYDRILDDLREKDTAALSLTLTDSNGVQWIVGVNTAGVLTTTQVTLGTYFILGGFMPLPQG